VIDNDEMFEDQESEDSLDEDNTEKVPSDDSIDDSLLDKKDYVMDVKLSEEMEKSFLSYAMSVIVARALPDARDGMKPVQRRILYTMSELNLYSGATYKKSARIVGDTMGKYHPHGDSAIYEAMVRMAQDFSYRYPLVDGHGNFGSVDGDGAAAMRYTEARMSKISGEMLRDLQKNTVKFVDNYDGSEQEPDVLPSRFPNLLVNGAKGIAVGMATNIPPHNLGEVIDGVLAMIHNPNITIDELMEYIPAPDFPTGAKIMGLTSVREAYKTGVGKITLRSKVKINKLSNNKKEIIITEIPYQVNKKLLIEKIADLAKEKAIEGITDLRDESSRKGMRIIIELKRDANSDVILNNLYKNTQLQTTYAMEMIALDHGQPKTMNLKELLKCYIDHQIVVVRNRTEYDLSKNKARLHIVEGFLIALANIDEVIHVIKSSKTDEEAIAKLQSKFLLSEIQAKSIMDMKLRRLTGLEVDKLNQEKEDLIKLISYLEDILANHDKLMGVIVEELKEISRKYNDERKSEIDFSEDIDVLDEDLIPVEDMIVTLTNQGYIKRLGVDSYRVQNRGGKGSLSAKMKETDFIEKVLFTSTHDNILFFTNLGKVFILKGYQIPLANKATKGLPVINLLKFEEGEKLVTIMNIPSLDMDGYLLFATKNGIIKKTEIRQYLNIRSTGIKAITINDGDELLSVQVTDGTKDIIFAASSGKAIRFNESTVRCTNRIAAGVKGIKVDGDDRAIGLAVINAEEDQIITLTETGYGKRISADAFKAKGRNGKGVKLLNMTEKTGRPVCLAKASDEEDLMVITNDGIVIRTPLSQISMIGRDAQGVRIIRLNDSQTVASIVIVPHAEESKEEELEEVDTNNVSEMDALLNHVERSFDYEEGQQESEDNSEEE